MLSNNPHATQLLYLLWVRRSAGPLNFVATVTPKEAWLVASGSNLAEVIVHPL